MKRQTYWAPEELTISATASSVIVSTDILAHSGRPGALSAGLTVTRTLIDLWFKSATPGSVSALTWAMAVFTDKIALASVPDPAADPYEYMGWGFLVDEGVGREFATDTFDTIWQHRYYDLKTQRKLKANQGVFFIFSESAAVTMSLRIGTRTMLKLP